MNNNMYKTTTLLFSLLLGLCFYPTSSSAQMIWPGDINNNGIVNGIDYLYWGVAIQQTGPARPNSTTEWSGQPMGDPWVLSFPQSTNMAYADVNGDGQINANDSELISEHFNRNHGVLTPDVYQQSYADNAPPFILETATENVQPGELHEVTFVLGDENRQISGLYGLSFAISYPPMALSSENGLSFSLLSDNILGDNNIAVHVHNDVANGRAEVTMVRTDGQAVNGYGKVGRFLLQFSDLSNENVPEQLVFEIIDIRAIRRDMSLIEMTPSSFRFSYTGGMTGNCPLSVDPVCGSNGITYLNSCFAEAAGIYNYTNGTCFDNDCIDPTLINPTTVCSAVYEPVCGCNGVTYVNECVADAAGVMSTTVGPCPTNNNCYDPQYVVASNATTVDYNTGVITANCTEEYDPVCGCNGVTYDNACLAEASGITVYTEGSCESACIDPYQMDWDANCTTQYDPVCGCNGVTYTNPCSADAAGVVTYTSGPCGGNSTWCQTAVPIQCGDFLPYETTVGAGNHIQQYPGCTGNANFQGADRIYVIQKESAGDLQIGLEILTPNLDLDLFLLSNNCGQITCLASSTTNNSVTNNEGIILEDAPIGTYYIVVDGQYAASVGDFRLEVSCGYLYCGDAVNLWCGETYNGNNQYGNDDVSLYFCDGNILNVENNGPEIVHTFTQTHAGPVNISLSGLSANLELFLLRSCDRGDCMEYSQNSGNNNEYISAYLPAGTYYIVVDGNNGAVSNYNLLVDCASSCDLQFTELYATSSGCGQASGVIHIRTSGGQPYYVVSYTGPLSGSFTTASDYCTISNLPPGTYTITKTGSQGCSVTQEVTILGGGSLSANLTPHDAVCSSLGSIGVYMSNGQAPYSVYLTGPSGGVNNYINSNSFTINDLAPGDYTVHITDQNGCSVSQQITINQTNGNFIWNYTVTAASCGGYGAIRVDTYNGDAPYNISLSGPVSGGNTTYYSSFNLINLPGGVYELTIEDNNWCRNTQTVVIPDGNLNIDLQATTGICNQDGSITVNISNGWPNYIISWTGPTNGSVVTSNSQYVLSNLPSGSYTISVEDDSGCTDYQTITVSNGEGGGLDFDIIPLPGSCSQNGALWIDIYNGSPLYTISWTGTTSGILSTENDGLDIPNLPCGWYHVVITDINGCSASVDVDLGGCSDLDVDLTPTNGICGQNGSILVTMYGGSPVYNVTWTGPVNGQSFTNTNITNISNLPAGTYTVNVVDANGCTNYAVTQISTVESNLTLTTLMTEATCGTEGSITTYLSGGTGPYQISWTGPESGSFTTATTTATIPNLISGTYQIYATDANGCSDSKTVYVTNQTNNLTISLVGNDGICAQYGNIGVYVGEGDGPFVVSWTGPVSGSASFSGNVYQIPNTPTGLYNVVVTDANGCSTSGSVQINVQNVLAASLTPYNGQCGINGSIQVDISQGVPNYIISWTGPSSGSVSIANQQYTISNLTAGDYTVVVVDQNGCSRTMNTTIQHSNDGLQIVTSLIYNICGQYNTIWIDIIGGTPPYTVTWTGTENGTGTTTGNGFEIMDLPPGTYKVTVVDANGCMDMEPDIIIYPSPIDLFTVTPDNGVCGENGSIQVGINNTGTAPFTLTWNGPVSGTQNYAASGVYVLNNMPSGTYTFTLIDSNGCSETETVTLLNGGTAVEIITALIYNECGQYNTIWIDVIGGTPPYTVTWTGTENGTGTTTGNGFEIMDLPPGTYKVTVVDVYGCMDMQQDIIVYPAPIDLFTATPTNGICSGPGSISVNILAGTAVYNLAWSGPSSGSVNFSTSTYTIPDLPVGTYTLILTDANGCSETETVTISTGEGNLNLLATPTNQTCITAASISVQASGGNGSYTLNWSGPESGSVNIGTSTYVINNLTPGSYTLSIGDGSGCGDTESVYLSVQEDDLAINLTPHNGLCGSSGNLEVSVSGSQAPYVVSWSGPSNGSSTINGQYINIPNLSAGTYIVQVVGNDGCSDSQSITISSGEGDLSLSTTANQQTCTSSASISVQASGGNGSYTLSWSGPESGSTTISSAPYLINNLIPGTYTLTIIDGNGCSDTKVVYVTAQVDDLTVSLNPNHSVCGSYGSIEVSINGSQSPYVVSWSGPSNGSSTINGQYVNIPNLTAGTYSIQVTGNDGCYEVMNTQVNNQGGNIYVTATPYNGNCGNTGSINVSLSGAVSYTVQWSGTVNGSATVNGSSYIINNLPAGTYTIQASSGSCSNSTTATVSTNNNTVTINATPNNGTCTLSSSIDVVLGGGVAPYQLSWQGAQDGLAVVNGNMYTVNNIPPGFYTLIATDANGCTRSTNVSLSENNLDVTVIPQNGTCGDNASIFLTINYGTAPYTINWAGAVDGYAISQTGSYTIEYLPAGTYQISVQDANGCAQSVTGTVTSVEDGIGLSVGVGNNGCGSFSNFWMDFYSGTPPYTIEWHGPIWGSATTDNPWYDVQDVPSGSYTVILIDADGCVNAQYVEVNNIINNLDVEVTPVPGSCGGLGSIGVSVQGGQSTYTIAWYQNNVAIGEVDINGNYYNISNLADGEYFIRISDQNECVQSVYVSLTSPANSLYVSATITPPSCIGPGSIGLIMDGGQAPYQISWTGPMSSSVSVNTSFYIINGLIGGLYQVTITDVNGCGTVLNLNIPGTTQGEVVSNFSYTVDGLNVYFQSLASNDYHIWELGDGTVSYDTNPEHTFSGPGTYHVCLGVSGSCGNDTYCQEIQVTTSGSGGAILDIGEATGSSGHTMSIPVSLHNAENFVSIAGSINIVNDDVATITSVTPALIAPQFNTVNNTFSYFVSGGGFQTLEEDAILFYLNVLLTGNTGESTVLEFSNTPLPIEVGAYIDSSPVAITVTTTNGSATIANMLELNGQLTTYWGEAIMDAEVSITGSGYNSTMMTGEDGIYSMPELLPDASYTVSASKNTAYDNGLSTYALFIGQRFLLGMEPVQITSPYQVIAGDANCNDAFTTLDLFLIQRLIIGAASELNSCPSWVFVSDETNMPTDFDAYNVFPYSSSATMLLTENETTNFVGVKVGDILGQANPEEFGGENNDGDSRTEGNLSFRANNTAVLAGEEITLYFDSNDFEDIVSYQFGLQFSTNKLQFLTFEAGEQSPFETVVIGDANAANGKLRLSWFSLDGEGHSASETTTLFALRFRALQDISDWNGLLRIDPAEMLPEAYNDTDVALEPQLLFGETVTSIDNPLDRGFELYQNNPNPFKERTNIGFYLPQSDNTIFSLRDALGRVVLEKESFYSAGEHQIIIDRSTLASGVYYYILKAGDKIATKAMVVE